MSQPIKHAFTVDVEDYYQVSAMEHRVQRSDWDRMDSRVVQNTDRMLSLLDRHNVQATFYILGWVANRFPSLVQRIAKSGHEIASHGFWHRLIYTQTPEEFAQDLSDSIDAITSACGTRPTAYRAPSFSITDKSWWALQVLAEHGFTDDSSVFPISGHNRYGVARAEKVIHSIETEAGSIREFPPAPGRFGKATLPIGGGYFRLFSLNLTFAAIRSVAKKAHPAMFYIHPWEIDPEQPKVHGLSRTTRFRHYVGLKKTEHKLDKLLEHFSFTTMSDAASAIYVA
ncbi:XrtA system polysaccharide deacetylase [Rhodopirellula sp. MGV]|uniref:XrtA system polysaccharide deacetylase n=1 Tax=Rhodopirellula sp. MGV TaxID=2023130 RepID=UPI000B96FBB8|nr:XrtA system polysaccharide deacetylase [Rhodopirellula sp. MGV]OYP33026.1 polysaccharide deacetylase family protein [Rhodopirellula sp. MGV]PNY35311.1 DUF3473 domain-containing protein [Rhodopirellula baltica]